MEIDATRFFQQFDDAFKGLRSREEIKAKWRQLIANRCTCCGAQNHRFSKEKHPNVTCHHCGKANHYAKVCLSRLSGEPATQRARGTDSNDAQTPEASTARAAATSDSEAKIAALKDLVETQRKQLESVAEKIQQHF